MKNRKILLIYCMFILIVFTLTACFDQERKFSSVNEKMDVMMSEIEKEPVVMRIDDTAGASYIYYDEGFCVLYQPSHYNKAINMGYKKDNIWYTYGFTMSVNEDKYHSFTPKVAVDGEMIYETYIKPFFNVTVVSEDKKEQTMIVSLEYGGVSENWDAIFSNKSFAEYRRQTAPTDVYMYYSGTKDYKNIVEAIAGEVTDADKSMGDFFRKKTEKILNSNVK